MLCVLFMKSNRHFDLRNSIRFPLHLPVTLTTPQSQYQAETSDISSGGVLFTTTGEVNVGSPVEFAITMPGKTLGVTSEVTVKCRGRVVRSVPETIGWNTAVVIDQYSIERN